MTGTLLRDAVYFQSPCVARSYLPWVFIYCRAERLSFAFGRRHGPTMGINKVLPLDLSLSVLITRSGTLRHRFPPRDENICPVCV